MRTVLALCAVCAVAGSALAAPLAQPPAPASRPGNVLADAGDDTDFLFRLGMMEGHLLVGHELLQAHQTSVALPHFGHPVREIYDDLVDYLKQKNFPAFDKQLVGLEAAVVAAPDSPDTEAKYQAAIATIHRARELTPPGIRSSLPDMIKICSDTIDAASGEFSEAVEQGKVTAIVEYHDSRGYLEFVDRQVKELQTEHPDPQSQSVLARFKAVLGKAQWIVGELLPASTPRASIEDYRAIAAEAAQIAKP